MGCTGSEVRILSPRPRESRTYSINCIKAQLDIRQLSNIELGLVFSADFFFDLRPLQVHVDARNVEDRSLDVKIRAVAARQPRQSCPLKGPFALSGLVLLTLSSNIPSAQVLILALRSASGSSSGYSK